MKYVIDSSVSFKWVVPEIDSDKADRLRAALAEQQGCELVTADVRLVANLRPSFPFIVPLASLP